MTELIDFPKLPNAVKVINIDMNRLWFGGEMARLWDDEAMVLSDPEMSFFDCQRLSAQWRKWARGEEWK